MAKKKVLAKKVASRKVTAKGPVPVEGAPVAAKPKRAKPGVDKPGVAKKLKAALATVRRRTEAEPARKAGAAALARALDRDGIADATVLDSLAATVLSRRTSDPAVSHSARLLGRGTAKVAQKFGEEAVECLIEAVNGNRAALVAESADVLYHLIVLWVDAGIDPAAVWAELRRREGVSGIAEKARRKIDLPTTKIP